MQSVIVWVMFLPGACPGTPATGQCSAARRFKDSYIECNSTAILDVFVPYCLACCRKNREEAPRPEGTEDVQAGTEEHLLGGDMWLWNVVDDMSWPSEDSDTSLASLDLLPWTLPLDVPSKSPYTDSLLSEPADAPGFSSQLHSPSDQTSSASATLDRHPTPAPTCAPNMGGSLTPDQAAPALPAAPSAALAASTPPQVPPVASASAFAPPAWMDTQAMGGAQRAAAGWVPGELAAEPNQASSQTQPPPPSPQSPPALNARKPRRDSTARNRVRAKEPRLDQQLKCYLRLLIDPSSQINPSCQADRPCRYCWLLQAELN